MTEYDATEIAYKNGYEKGYEDGLKLITPCKIGDKIKMKFGKEYIVKAIQCEITEKGIDWLIFDGDVWRYY